MVNAGSVWVGLGLPTVKRWGVFFFFLLGRVGFRKGLLVFGGGWGAREEVELKLGWFWLFFG